MPLLKSLFCYKGFDNGRRFLVINLACYLLFMLLAPALAQAMVLLVLLLLVCSPLMLASSMRRVRDAGFQPALAVLSLLIYWLCVFGVSFIEHGASWTLLLLGAMVTLLLATISSSANQRERRDYIMGYAGPVDLRDGSARSPGHHAYHQRIEPVIAAADDEKLSAQKASQIQSPVEKVKSESHVQRATKQEPTWEQKLGVWLRQNQKQSIIASLVVLSVVIFSIILSFWLEPEPQPQPPAEAAANESVKQRHNKVEMPDSFWLMHDQYDAITIAWQGDYKKDGEYWSAMTAEGDIECAQVKFVIRDDYRPLKVTVKNAGDYYADFSPLDTQAIIQSIAVRDRFSLCGYEFSLKGTQAVLMTNKKYSAYLVD